jgi:hypothetical protein
VAAKKSDVAAEGELYEAITTCIGMMEAQKAEAIKIHQAELSSAIKPTTEVFEKMLQLLLEAVVKTTDVLIDAKTTEAISMDQAEV